MLRHFVLLRVNLRGISSVLDRYGAHPSVPTRAAPQRDVQNLDVRGQVPQ